MSPKRYIDRGAELADLSTGLDPDELPSPDDGPEELLETLQRVAAVRKAVASLTLSSRERTAIRMRLDWDASLQQIADTLGCSHQCVSQILARVRRRLRPVLEGLGVR